MFGIAIDRTSSRPVSLQLLEALRGAVHEGRLPSGSALPSTRKFAEELGISRRLAAEIYDQLVSEGYFTAKRGSGTWVRGGLSAAVRQARRPEPERPLPPVKYDFSPGIPDLGAFPRRAWLRAMDDALSFAAMRSLSYGPLQGEPELRAAVAAYLFRHRGIAADPGEIVITAGTSHAFLLLSLLRISGAFYHEDPGSGFGRGAFLAAGTPVAPVPVDADGADPASLAPLAGSLIALNPSHQFPTGTVLPIARRLKFLEIAGQTGSFLIEDDYDSEFRLKGQPVPALYALNPDRVLYLGSFSKSLAPFLRCGYLLAPPEIRTRLLSLARQVNARTSGPTALALARLLSSGQVDRHVFRQKRSYLKRQTVIVDWLNARGFPVSIRGRETGSHLYLEWSDRGFDGEFVRRCRDLGLRVVIGAEFHQNPERGRHALVLGYGNIAEAKLPEGLALLERELMTMKRL